MATETYFGVPPASFLRSVGSEVYNPSTGVYYRRVWSEGKNCFGWNVITNQVMVNEDPTITPPLATDYDIVVYNKTPYRKISNTWTPMQDDTASMIATAIAPINAKITNLQSIVNSFASQYQKKITNVNLSFYTLPTITSTATIMAFDNIMSGSPSLYSMSDKCISMPSIANLEISGKMLFNLTATLAIAVGTVINVYAYYMPITSADWTTATKILLRSYRVNVAIALNASLKDEIILPVTVLPNIPNQTKVAIFTSQNTTGTVVLDNAAYSNFINYKVIP